MASRNTDIMTELTVPWEDRMKQSNVLKKERYSELSMDLTDKRYRVHLFAIEIGARGLVGKSSYTFLKEIGLPGREGSKAMDVCRNGITLAVDKKRQAVACLH